MFLRLLTFLKEFSPKSFLCLNDESSKKNLTPDLIAGISIGIISLPLTMAFAIAGGLPPEKGLITGIVGGFLVALLGGSRFQIAGPTGAFVVVVFDVVQRHGYEGLAIATFMAGILMMIFGLARAGMLLKFIPYPVTIGFTTGIAVSLFSSQLKDLFGLPIANMSPEFLQKWSLYFEHISALNPWAFGMGLGCLIIIVALRYLTPRFPSPIAAIALATGVSFFFDLPIETIQTKFGAIPSMLPAPSLPAFDFEQIRTLFPDALTIALLASIESVLSAMVADGMTGTRHKSNTELLAQGIGNVASSLFGGIPVTGAIARTAANIKMGAKTPIAGMTHAVVLFFLMAYLSGIAAQIPLTALAATLIYIAWNMCEIPHVISICRGPKSDLLLLATSFILTLLIDITVAVQAGVLLGALLFMKKMTDSTGLKASKLPKEDDHELVFQKDVPEGVAVYEVNGPLFFGVAFSLNDEMYMLSEEPKIFILRLHQVPLIDASGIQAIKEVARTCRSKDIQLLISGVSDSKEKLFRQTGIEQEVGKEHLFKSFKSALLASHQILTSIAVN